MKTIYAILIIGFIFCLQSCGGHSVTSKESKLQSRKLISEKDYEITTDSEVNWHSYTFKNYPLVFTFSDKNSQITYGTNFRRPLNEIFYTKETVLPGCGYANKYALDFQNFNADPTENLLIYADEITTEQHKYLLLIFRKNQATIGPLETFPSYIIDITNPKRINAFGFIYREEEGTPVKYYSKNGKLSVTSKYYTQTKPQAYKTKVAMITQDSNDNWVIQEK